MTRARTHTRAKSQPRHRTIPRRYYDYRGLVDGDCRVLGAFLEYDCRTFRECPVGMQEVGSGRSPVAAPAGGRPSLRQHVAAGQHRLPCWRNGMEWTSTAAAHLSGALALLSKALPSRHMQAAPLPLSERSTFPSRALCLATTRCGSTTSRRSTRAQVGRQHRRARPPFCLDACQFGCGLGMPNLSRPWQPRWPLCLVCWF